MSQPTDRAGFPGELNLELKRWCQEHEAPFKAKRCNDLAVFFGFMEALHEKAAQALHKLPEDVNPDMLANTYASAMNFAKPMCCQVTDAQRAAILAKAPATTGDKHKDEEIATMLYRSAERHRPYPNKPGSYTYCPEGGKDYYLCLSELFKDMPRVRQDKIENDHRTGKKRNPNDMIVILTEGHPNHPRGTNDTCTVLHVGVASSIKDAREQFREWLNEKSWLREDAKPS